MKILIVASDDIPHIGGKSTHIYDLMDALKNHGHEVFVISHRSIPSVLQYLIKCSLIPIRLFKNSLYVYSYQRLARWIFRALIWSLCQRQQIDVISAQDAVIVSACRKVSSKLRIPVTMTMHTYFAVESTLDSSGIRLGSHEADLILKGEVASLKLAKYVIAVDDRIKEHVKMWTKMTNEDVQVESVSNFTNVDTFSPVATSLKQKLRSIYGIASDRFVVVCARRLVEKNGVIFAVKAMNSLPKESNIVLLVVGEGVQKTTLEKYVAENNLQNRVILLGSRSREEMQNIYRLSDASVVPSITVNGLQEATSISAIESMACGLPIVASEIGGLREIIKDGRTGFLVPEQDQNYICEKLLLLEQDGILHSAMSLCARQYVCRHHSHLETAKRFLGVYSSLVRGC